MSNSHQGNSRIAKNTLFLYIRMFFAMIVSLYTSRVILRVLGVVDFGVNNVVGGFVTMFAFLNTSLIGAIQRYYNYERSKNGDDGIQQVYRVSILIQIVLSLVVLLALESFGVWYLNNVMVIPTDRLLAANILFQVSTVALLLLIVSVPFSAAIVSFEHMDFYAIVGILDVILKLVIVLVLPLLPYDKLIVYSLLLLLISIINFFLYFVYAKIKFRSLVFRGRTNVTLLKSMLVFSGWNFVGTFSNVVYQQGVNLLLNFFFGPIINAARGLSNYISNAIRGFSSNIVVAFRPQLVESYAKEDYQRTKNIMFSETKLCFLMLFLIILPLIIEIRYVLLLWLGEGYPDHTESFSILVLLQMLIASLNIPFSQVVHASAVMKKFQIITSVITCLVIPLGWVGLKIGLPPESVYIISVILAICSQLACILIVKGIFPFNVKDYIVKILLPLLLLSIVSPIIPFFIHSLLPQSFMRLCLVIIATTMIISAISYFGILTAAEKELGKGIVRKILKK